MRFRRSRRRPIRRRGRVAVRRRRRAGRPGRRTFFRM